MKKLILFIFILLILIVFYPEKAFAQSGIMERATGALVGIWNFIKNVVSAPVRWAGEKLAQFIVWLIEKIAIFFFILISTLNNIVAGIVDYFASLNPFSNPKGGLSPTESLWQILKTLAYIILTFSALFAGFEWLRGNDTSAKRLIFNIIIVALLINFSFILVKEVFNIAWNLEKGISGGASAGEDSKIGTLVAASLWQRDPFSEVNNFFNKGVANEDTEGLGSILARGFSYLFLVVFAIIIFIVLIMILAFYIARYIIFILLAGVSPLALASLTFPEARGTASEVLVSLRFFEKWVNYLIRWMIVIPVLVIMVILGNFIHKNVFADSSPNDLIQFLLNLVFLLAWYLISMNIAIKLSGAVGKFAQAAAVTGLLSLGALGAGAIWFKAQGRVGRAIQKWGERISESRLPTFIRYQGKKLMETGKEMVKRRWEREAGLEQSIIEERIERLNRETNEEEKERLRKEIAQRLQRYSKTPEVLKAAAPSLEKMTDENAFAFLRESAELFGREAPQELRGAMIKRIERASRKALRDNLSDSAFASKLDQISGDLIEALAKRAGDELKPEDVVQILGKKDVRDVFKKGLESEDPKIRSVYEKLRDTYNRVSDDLAQAMIDKNIDEATKIAGSLSSVIKSLPRLESQFKDLGVNQEALIKEALNNIDAEMAKSLWSIRKNLSGDSLRMIQEHFEKNKGELAPETLQTLSRILAQSPESKIIIAKG